MYRYIFCCSPVQRLGIQATKEEHHSNIVEVVANITKFVPWKRVHVHVQVLQVHFFHCHLHGYSFEECFNNSCESTATCRVEAWPFPWHRHLCTKSSCSTSTKMCCHSKVTFEIYGKKLPFAIVWKSWFPWYLGSLKQLREGPTLWIQSWAMCIALGCQTQQVIFIPIGHFSHLTLTLD